ncbi:MAG: PPC domain-containing protein [Saccharospirillaceae bacterium]|nr:PPC domain-containing protein [Saccharospirillaceae bacterium]
MNKLSITTNGGSGDADLYVRAGAKPSTSAYDCRPYVDGNNETCSFDRPSAGTWHLGIRGYSSYSGVDLNASWE